MLGDHKRVALQFSGGKDSLACLYLLKEYWDRLTVVWVNTGDAFPETLVQMDAIKHMVPHFLEVKSDQPAQVCRDGSPSDLVPAWDTPMGRVYQPGRKFKVQSPFGCCGENIWIPMHRAMVDLGVTLIVRGQRIAEKNRAPIRSGTVENGIEYMFPIEDWSDERVFEFLEQHGVGVPGHYRYVNSSLDCQTCTAYLAENVGKFHYMKRFHPALHRDVQARISTIIAAVQAEFDNLKGALA